MLTKNTTIRTAMMLGATMLWPMAAAAQQLIDFFQVDGSEDVQTVVLVKAAPFGEPAKPAPLLSASYTHWEDGQTASVGYVYRWALATGDHKLNVGLGGGGDWFHSSDSGNQSDPDARGQIELSGPAPGGTYYALAQAKTFRHGALGLLQYNFADSPWGLEGSYYTETGHHHFTGAVNYRFPNKWFLRGGVIASDKDRPFIGVGYNGF
jgi:hypothetical protein